MSNKSKVEEVEQLSKLKKLYAIIEGFGLNKYTIMSGIGSASKMSLPGPLKVIGKKQIEIATQWFGSAAVFGATAGIGLTYATDWKLILQYLPYYNGKFPPEEEK